MRKVLICKNCAQKYGCIVNGEVTFCSFCDSIIRYKGCIKAIGKTQEGLCPLCLFKQRGGAK